MGLLPSIGIGWSRKRLLQVLAVRATGARRVLALSEPLARAFVEAGYEVQRALVTNGQVQVGDSEVEIVLAPIEALCRTGWRDEVIAELAHALRPGGLLCLVGGGLALHKEPSRARLAALLLHAGLAEVEQLEALGSILSIGRRRLVTTE
jgi:hypothetical protein